MPIRIFSLIWNDLYVVNHLPLSTIGNNSSLGRLHVAVVGRDLRRAGFPSLQWPKMNCPNAVYAVPNTTRWSWGKLNTGGPPAHSLVAVRISLTAAVPLQSSLISHGLRLKSYLLLLRALLLLTTPQTPP
jgi:hypothetical protein